MKSRLLLFILIINIPSFIFCQINNPPKVYLNGKEFRWNNTFVNPNNIGSMNVKKDTANAEIFIKTKDGKWKYKSLKKFVMSFSNYKQIYDQSTTPIFIIDGTLITNPDSVRIDASYFGEAKISKLSNVKGVPEQCKNLIFVNIKLSKEPIIYIRGNDLPNIDSLNK
jgi:hypothetical protein